MTAEAKPQLVGEQKGGGEHISLFNEYGIYVVPPFGFDYERGTIESALQSPHTTCIVSVPTWQEASEALTSCHFGSSVVLLPELITLSGAVDPEDLADRELVLTTANQHIAEAQAISSSQPDTTFLVGTPHYIEELDRPYNAAFVIKEGDIVDVVHKRILTRGEETFVLADYDQPACVVGESTVIICKDIFGLRDEALHLIKFISSREVAEKMRDVELLADGTDTLLVLSCWGGSSKTLKKICRRVLNNNGTIKRIILSDRLPSLTQSTGEQPVTKTPLSLVAFRSS